MFSDRSIRLMIRVSRLGLITVALLLLIIAGIQLGGGNRTGGLSTLAGVGLFVLIFVCVQFSTRGFRLDFRVFGSAERRGAGLSLA